MFETLIWIMVGWAIGSFLLSMTSRRSVDESVDDIRDIPPNSIVEMTIQMEEFKGWWYGWFCSDSGSETFIGQGTTYDDALNNCRKIMQERYPDLKLKYNFEMKNANTTVQN